MRTPWRQNAAHCLEAMRATTNPEIRAMLLSMAERWAQRAEQTEYQSDTQGATMSPHTR
ncbi:MAG: hypothetical protein JO328_22375 [Hyphomicrobiales bacterium]|nr:hypothetical protein [Hyphomicrobiales bacterium]